MVIDDEFSFQLVYIKEKEGGCQEPVELIQQDQEQIYESNHEATELIIDKEQVYETIVLAERTIQAQKLI